LGAARRAFALGVRPRSGASHPSQRSPRFAGTCCPCSRPPHYPSPSPSRASSTPARSLAGAASRDSHRRRSAADWPQARAAAQQLHRAGADRGGPAPYAPRRLGRSRLRWTDQETCVQFRHYANRGYLPASPERQAAPIPSVLGLPGGSITRRITGCCSESLHGHANGTTTIADWSPVTIFLHPGGRTATELPTPEIRMVG
jgi:hypothetical protein